MFVCTAIFTFIQLYYHLGDGKLFEKEMKSSPEYAVVAKLYKVKW